MVPSGPVANQPLYVHGILITEADILRAAKAIGGLNGAGTVTVGELNSARNPGWILSGNTLRMPDGSRYTVRQGDSIRSIALGYIRATLEDALRQYHVLLMEYGLEYRIAPVLYQKRAELILKLQKLEEGVFSENFTRMIQGMISELKSE
jgi:hypothetical protein